MGIDYKKFNDCSPATQQELIDFAKMVLTSIELLDLENEGKIILFDFEAGKFDLAKTAGRWKTLDKILGGVIPEITNDHITGWGPMESRRLTVDITIKYKPNAVSVMKEFLKNVDRKHDGKKDNAKILLEINKETKEVHNTANNKTYQFRKAGGKNKRFDYLASIVTSSGKVGGKKLNPNVSSQGLSSEIENINKNLKQSLGLVDKVITNRNNSGYGKNDEVYNFRFV